MKHTPNRPSKLSRPLFRRNKYDNSAIYSVGGIKPDNVSNACVDCGFTRYTIKYGDQKTQICGQCGKETVLND